MVGGAAETHSLVFYGVGRVTVPAGLLAISILAAAVVLGLEVFRSLEVGPDPGRWTCCLLVAGLAAVEGLFGGGRINVIYLHEQ